MKLTTINIQGNIFTSEILEKIRQDDIRFQSPKDFNLKPSELVRDEISNAWSLLNTHWQIFKQKRNVFTTTDTGTSEVRKYWMLPLLSLLGYEINAAAAEMVNEKSYAISHRATNKDGFPIHIVGSEQSLDKKAEHGTRLSPHSLVQEYVNSTEHIYGYVTNGIHFRVLRDATRLSRLSYLEFNLEQMVEEGHYAEFALLYRLLHATRISDKKEDGKDSILEYYHNEALASGSRIRERLSEAVEHSILALANGLLQQNHNQELINQLAAGQLSAKNYYLHILRSVYRILFLLVIEERSLIYKEQLSEEEKKLKNIYYRFYSIQRLTLLVNRAIYVDPKKTDLWASLLMTFRLFEDQRLGKKLGIDALGSGIFNIDAIGSIEDTILDNKTVLEVFRHLVTFENESKQTIRVNYADLDVEEFGSVYEGLLEFEPLVENNFFRFKQGDDRSSSGSHYTPEELVKPLITHSLDYIIAHKLKETDPEKALLSITVCDVACGSGHILLSAARRIGFELAKLRSREEQPTPSALRVAIRDVIRNCIYGVDLNPLAVELCKVALWLEAHEPGEPLNFLDHHIKNGNAIVGLTHRNELENGIADEAFKTLPGDTKTIASSFSKRNKEERKRLRSTGAGQQLTTEQQLNNSVEESIVNYKNFNQLPETTPEEIERKAKAYKKFIDGKGFTFLKAMADTQVAQFFVSKTEANKDYIMTDADFRLILSGYKSRQDRKVAKATVIALERSFFHWFLEFPEVFSNGGFDCVLGNPPFLGGQKLSGAYGNNFLEYIKYAYQPIGAVDLVTYFFRRIFNLLKPGGFQSLISTNTIAQGGAREGGLDVICSKEGVINHAVRSMRWPGQAAVEVSLVTIHKGEWNRDIILNNKKVDRITPYLDDSEVMGNPFPLKANSGKSFQGSIVLGKGFIITPQQAHELIARDGRNKDVLFPYLNGDDLNNDPLQQPSRWVINFFDWPEEKARTYPDCFKIVEDLVKPERDAYDETKNSWNRSVKKNWWMFGAWRKTLDMSISELHQVMAINRYTKYLTLDFQPNNVVFSDSIVIFTLNSFYHYSIYSSSIHEIWAWKNSSTMGSSTLRYSPTNSFETFPLPASSDSLIEKIGSELYCFRKSIMAKAQIGFTQLYNTFHSIDLNKNHEIKEDILGLRRLHSSLDEAVIRVYKWDDILLKYDFYEIEFLPENDRIRFTLNPSSRKEIIKRLLILNRKHFNKELELKKNNDRGGLFINEGLFSL